MFHGEVGFCGSGARRGACLFGYLLIPPLVLLLPPIPPAPFPGGEGGDSKIILPGASPPAPRHLTVCGIYRPCHTGAGRHWERGRTTRPAGGAPSLSPAYPAFSLLFCPPSPKGKDIPPTPFPTGEGGDSRLFHARGFAPCIPGAEPARHWERGRTTHPAGVCLVCRLPTLPLVYFFAPIPLPPSPTGKGEIQGYFMQGASPLASPGQNPRGTGKGGEPRARRGAYLFGRLPTLPFAFLSAPLPRRGRISPQPPSPAGKGDQGYFMQGASPLASPGLNPRGTGKGGEPRARRGTCPGVAA